MEERELLGEIQAIFARTRKPNLLVPNGDDGAVFRSEGNVIACADVAVEGVHFNLEWSSLFEVGRKITAANLADVCAMGGWPTFLLVTVVLPKRLLSGALDLAKGIAHEADLVGAQVIGGDLSEGNELSISITALGETQRSILRSGAKVGDLVMVSELPGFSAAGLSLLRSSADFNSELASRAVAQHKAPSINYEKYRAAFNHLNSAIDISDGLVTDAGHIAESSGVNLDLSREALASSELKELDKENFIEWVLGGGEDHVLLVTAAESIPGFQVIGRVQAGSGVSLDGKEISGRGYSHRWN